MAARISQNNQGFSIGHIELRKSAVFKLFACIAAVALSSAFEIGAATAQSADEVLPFWEVRQIPVCWEEDTTDPKDRELVESEVTTIWQRYSNIGFTGWDACTSNSHGIRISVDDGYLPKVKVFGRFLDGTLEGMLLNFNMAKPGITPRCINRHNYCLKVAAVHEFGHALGFFHQSSPTDGNITIRRNAEKVADWLPQAHLLGKSDFLSVMNTCNPRWNGNGELSAGDIGVLQKIYDALGSVQIEKPVSARLSLQSGIQPDANGENRLPLGSNDCAYTFDFLDLYPK